jgi:DNA-binding transcriptional LysR family regulator
MDSVDPMRVFISAIELKSFSAAADRMQLTPSAVSKIVSRLEDRLGVRLINRTTRRISATPEGEAYFNGAKYIVAEIDEMEAAVGQSSTRPKGLLRVNTGTAFGVHHLMPKLPLFLERYPEINVSVEITDRRIDIVGEKADLAIRTGPVGEETLIARGIAEMQRVICASPGYLERMGTPQRPEDLAQHACLLISDQPSLNRWPFRGTDGAPMLLEVRGRATANTADGLARLAIAGGGIIRLGDLIVADALRLGALVPLLEDTHVAEAVPISAVYPSGRHRAPKVRVFVEFLIEQFRDAPWRRIASR